jgi:hypothetical protein
MIVLAIGRPRVGPCTFGLHRSAWPDLAARIGTATHRGHLAPGMALR